MRTLMFVVVLLLVGIAALGFYQGWFRLSTDGTGHTPSATITVDKDKFHADEELAQEKVHRFEQKMKETTGGPTDKVKQ